MSTVHGKALAPRGQRDGQAQPGRGSAAPCKCELSRHVGESHAHDVGDGAVGGGV